jgi:hypothetical protein
MSGSLSPERWRDLLDEAFATGLAFDEITVELDGAADDQKSRLQIHQNHYQRVLSGLLREYTLGLPRPAISRCPFTEKVVNHSLDHYGLEGFWWNHDGPARPIAEDVPPTWLALTGAVYLRGHVNPAPFLCKPGPEVPYVVPRVLAHPNVQAVLSSMPIGDHWGYAIAYFGKPFPTHLPLVNTWGADHLRFRTPDGEWAWDEQVLDERDMDFELDWWIDAGKLSWVAPNDADLQLRTEVDGCPYLGLPGRRSILRIENGRVWSMEELV